MAKITKVKVTYGLSYEDQTVWHKPECGVEVELEPGDTVEKVFQDCWDKVRTELSKEIEKHE